MAVVAAPGHEDATQAHRIIDDVTSTPSSSSPLSGSPCLPVDWSYVAIVHPLTGARRPLGTL